MVKVRGLVLSTAFLAACVVGSPAAHAAAACEWVTTPLPVPAGVVFHGVYAASDSGEWVLGQGENASYEKGTFVWRNGMPTGEFIPQLGTVGDVNDSGVLVSNVGDAGYRIGNGVRERLEPAPGTSWSWGEHINNGGDVAGMSGLRGPLLVWPAGSTTPRELPNTRNGPDRVVKGIDDDGNVVAVEYGPPGKWSSHVWDRDGNRTALEPLAADHRAEVEFIRNGRIFGRSAPHDGQRPGTVVEWGLDGEIVRTFPEFSRPVDANASGHVLGQVSVEGEHNAVWREPGQLDTPPGVHGLVLADSGDVYGNARKDNELQPRHARCG